MQCRFTTTPHPDLLPLQGRRNFMDSSELGWKYLEGYVNWGTCPGETAGTGWAEDSYAADSFLTLRDLRFFSASHKSYCACWFNQLSEEVPNARERRTAISGLMPARPFNVAERVFRLTPSASAASVILSPISSIHSARSTSPGWGGLCIFIINGFIIRLVSTP